MVSLCLTYRPEDEWHGELTASVESDGFAGRSSAWFNRSQIENFASQLDPCPIENQPVLAGGHFDAGGTLVTETLGLRLAVHDARGNLLVCVHVATEPSRAGSKPDQDLTACFVTNYAEAADFKSELRALLDARAEQAVLRGRS